MRRRSALRPPAVAALTALAALAEPAAARAQGSGVYGQGIRLNLDSTGSKYVRFILWNQTWLRAQQMNPDTRINGQDAKSNFDIGIRRARVIAYGQLTPASLVMLHFGINNQTFNSGGAPGEPTGPGKKPQLFLHDLWYEQRVVPNKLYVGAGLSYWNGVSRQSSASTVNFLGIDAPIFNFPNIDANDQFARMPSVYAKGKFGRLDYRVALSQPFVPGAALSTLPTTGSGATLARVANQAVYSNTTRTKATQGYLMWQALQTEPNVLPFTVGTYLGTRRVFNVGAGWYHQPAAMRYYTGSLGADSVRHHRETLLGFDVFADLPFGPAANRTALTVYGVLYDYNYGPNFVRNVGIMNIGTAAPATTPSAPSVGNTGQQQGAVFNGGGNAFPLMGTGTIAHLETGYLLPRGATRGVGRLQPYLWLTRSDFDRLDDAYFLPEGGVNWHLEGHHAKYTLHYRPRPVYRGVLNPDGTPARRADGLTRQALDGRRGEAILQAQVYF